MFIQLSDFALIFPAEIFCICPEVVAAVFSMVLDDLKR